MGRRVKASAETSQNGVPLPILALIYDFDGTLSPRPMQEYSFLPQIGEDPKAFWQEVGEVAKGLVFAGEALQCGKPSAPLPVGQRRRGRGRGLPALSRGTQLGLARRVLDDAAGKARRGEDVQPMRLTDLGVKLAHHIEVQRRMTTDR